jgi:arylsulfatase A-like enzyme
LTGGAPAPGMSHENEPSGSKQQLNVRISNSARNQLTLVARRYSRTPSETHDTMIDHDKNVGTILKALDDVGIVGNTFVMYSTDNGPHMNSWPDGAMTPFRSEKNTNWEGAYRVPAMFRWPGKIKPDQVSNEIVSHLDMLPTILAIGGDPDVKAKLLKGYTVGDMTHKVHLDVDNLVPYLNGQSEKSPSRPRPRYRDVVTYEIQSTNLGKLSENVFDGSGKELTGLFSPPR